jgi:DNA-binding beta-propeller fold protein YncE
MRKGLTLVLGLLGCAMATAQMAPIPTSTELSGRPYAIKKTWVIGGTGNWDYLTMDPAAHLLYIAHGATVQVVDVETGAITAAIGGFREAHQVALDEAGQFGYVTDGPADQVKVFDRSSFNVVAVVPTGPRPRSLAYDPQTGLVLVFCGAPVATGAASQTNRSGQTRGANSTHASERPLSTISVIDGQTHMALAHILVPGRLGFGQVGSDGHVYVTDEERNQIARFNMQSLGTAVHDLPLSSATDGTGANANKAPLVDWSGSSPGMVRAHYLALATDCGLPRSLAVDGAHQRLFVACDNQKMDVIDSESGSPVTSLTIGPGPDAIGYDAGRGLIYTANGGGYGSITVIHQDLNDTYTVLQNLPTMQQARTMAIDPSTGAAYLVTTLYGANLKNPPAQGIGTLKIDPVDGTFQVLVIAN